MESAVNTQWCVQILSRFRSEKKSTETSMETTVHPHDQYVPNSQKLTEIYSSHHVQMYLFFFCLMKKSIINHHILFKCKNVSSKLKEKSS